MNTINDPKAQITKYFTAIYDTAQLLYSVVYQLSIIEYITLGKFALLGAIKFEYLKRLLFGLWETGITNENAKY